MRTTGGGLAEPQGLVFCPDNDLYVGEFGKKVTLRFNGTTGATMGVFAGGGA